MKIIKVVEKADEGGKYELYRMEGSLWRIRALKSFGKVKEGDIGGLIKSEDNLSQRGQLLDLW